jgi:hypothetical protein
MILEGIVTTLCDDGSPNISPMGPAVESSMERLILRPFRTSTTYENLMRVGEGVFHVTDDVHLLARAAIGQISPQPTLLPAPCFKGVILADACRWYAFRVASVDNSSDRATMECRVVDRGRLRDFFGFNRAKHAVLEAAILATRLHLLPANQIDDEFGRFRVLVEKTAGDQERLAFQLLETYVSQWRAGIAQFSPQESQNE